MSIRTSRRAFTRGVGAAALGAAALGATGIAGAQGKTTRILVAFPPGGPVDLVARAIGEGLAKELGHTIVIENKPGGNGAIAANTVAQSPADGSTLWLTSVGAVAINPALYEKLQYDPVKDLAPVSLVVNNVEVLVVHPDAPYATGADLVAAAKKRTDKPVTMASSGTGSVPHLAAELLRDVTGANLMHVPYKGAAPAIADVMGGHVDGFFGDIPGLIGQIRNGKLKAIGLAAPKRHPALPDVRTFDEMGIVGVDSDNWYALFAARATPAAEIDRVNQAVRKVLADPAIGGKLLASGATPAASTPAELSALLKRDSDKWAKVIKAKNIKPE